LASLAGWSGEMPRTVMPAEFRLARLSRKSQASLVQPGVIAAGQKYTITRWPRNEDSETSLPSASSNVNSGAGSPGASRLSVIGPPVGCGLSRESAYERGQRAEGPAAVADRVLGFRGHLGGGLAAPVGQAD